MSILTSAIAEPVSLRIGRSVGQVVSLILLVAAGFTLVNWFVSKPADIPGHPWSTVEGQAILSGWGIPLTWWIALYATMIVGLLTSSVAAAVLLLRAEMSWFRLYLAVVLVFFATVGSDIVLVFDAMLPGLNNLGQGLQGPGWLSLYLMAYVYPDGRFVPSWTRGFAIAFALYIVLSIGLQPANAPAPALLDSVVLLILVGSCAVAQIYRFSRVSSHLQRQQTRLLVVAFGLWFAAGLIFNLTPLGNLFTETSPAGLIVHLAGTLLTYLIFALVPIAITVAVLRYRLFDIDVWISRALLYAVLTGLTIAVFSVVATVLGRIWADSESIAPVVAVTIVALLFNPARSRVQDRVNRFVFGDRDNPYQALSSLGRQLESLAAPERVAPVIVDSIAHTLKVPFVAVQLDSHDAYAAVSGQQPADIETFELRHGNERIGSLIVGLRSPGERFSRADVRLLEDLARHSGIAIHAAQETLRTRKLAVDLQHARERMVASREEERRRIRRDLHDSLGPALGSQALTIDVIRSNVVDNPALAAEMLVDLKALSQDMLTEVRQMARELRPPALDELGLGPALAVIQEMSARSGLGVDLHVGNLPELPTAAEVAIYRIVDEAMNNVVRHACATQCRIEVMAAGHLLHLSIVDNGAGIRTDARAGVGTASMRERAEELGGTFALHSQQGQGTRINVTIPYTRRDEP